MWLAKILAVNPLPSEAADSTCTPVTIAELNGQRQTAIRKMVASIARHDFLNARRYSNEGLVSSVFCTIWRTELRRQGVRQPHEPPFVYHPSMVPKIPPGRSLCRRPRSSSKRTPRPQCRYRAGRAINWAVPEGTADNAQDVTQTSQVLRILDSVGKVREGRPNSCRTKSAVPTGISSKAQLIVERASRTPFMDHVSQVAEMDNPSKRVGSHQVVIAHH